MAPAPHPQRRSLYVKSAAIAYEGTWPLQLAWDSLGYSVCTDMSSRRLDLQLQLVSASIGMGEQRTSSVLLIGL